MPRVWLIRHGETENNQQLRFTGHDDVSLNERGRQQAEALIRHFEGKAIGPILCGPLQRTQHTALPLAQAMHCELEIDPAFDDVDVGRWQGRSVEEIRQTDPVLFQAWVDHPESFVFPEGESVQAVQQRAVQGLRRRLQARGAVKNDLVVVTHQIVIKVLQLVVSQRELSEFWQEKAAPGSIHGLEIDLGIAPWNGDDSALTC